MAHDSTLKRVTVANDDGDVYVESVGTDAEIVLKTQKVRVDGDVYCGASSSVGLSSRIDALKPPKCIRPGGDKLQHDGSNWTCVCVGAYGGSTCESTWSAEARVVNSTDNSYGSMSYGPYNSYGSMSYDPSAHHVSAFGDEILVGNGGAQKIPMILKRSPSGAWDAVWNLSSAYLWIAGTDDSTNAGASVALSGDIAVLGAPWQQFLGACTHWYNSSGMSYCAARPFYRRGPGFALVFERNADAASSWTLSANLTASDLNLTYDVDSRFGRDVAVSGGYALASTATYSVATGQTMASVYVFERAGSTWATWTQTTKLVSPSTNTFDSFGASIAISGEFALLGAHTDSENGNSAGAAYVYERSSTGAWEQKSKLVAFDATQGDQFGYQVSLSGNYALIGSPHDNEFGQSSGSAYVFTRSATTGDWTLDVKLTATNSAPGDRFGESVSISGTRVLVGAPGKSSAFGGSGVAYLFERQQDGTWKETGKLTDFDGVYSEFAKAVSVSSEYAAAASIDSMYYSNAGHTVHVIANVTSATDIA